MPCCAAVPRSLLEQVLQLQSFQCPSCNDWQQLNLDAAATEQLRVSYGLQSAGAQHYSRGSYGGSLNGHDYGYGTASGLNGEHHPVPEVSSAAQKSRVFSVLPRRRYHSLKK